LGQRSAQIQSNGADLLPPTPLRARNLVERFFNKIKQCRRVATRYDKLAANYLAFIQLASIRLWLRVYEFTALAHGRAKLCDQALRKLTNFRTFDIAQKRQNEKHYALERPSDGDPEQLQMLRD
jgi:hypothetical protein